MKTKIYLDTSIPSAYYDNSKPVRQLVTQKWFEIESDKYEIYVSTLTLEEINNLDNELKRNNILDIVDKFNGIILDITKDVYDLSVEYMNRGAIPKSEPEDALHIAAAVINNIDSLASWNFKHIVSVNPIRKIHEINQKRNLGLIEIGSLELFGGYKYGNL